MENLADTTYAVERIEAGVAICECLRTGARIRIDVKHLPGGIIEGDIIRQEGDRLILDQAADGKPAR